MEMLGMVSLLIALVLSFITLAGLIKPWWVMWWSAEAYRLKVLRWYGIPALMAWLLWLVLP
jgi:hypothetical protein